MSHSQDVKKNYIRFGSHYLSRLFLLSVLTGLLALIVLYSMVLHPIAVNQWLRFQSKPEFKLDSPHLASFTGVARLLLSDGSLLFEGRVEDAAAQGEGRLFEGESLLFEGEFSQNMFHGFGTLFSSAGLVRYTGNFEVNKFHGEGRLYDEYGNLKFEGNFINGIFYGHGTLHYVIDGISYTYAGEFAAGAQTGFARLYRNGRLKYEGDFKDGVFQGAGHLYFDDGILQFTGGFSNGLFDGNGRLFFENGSLQYDGSFSAGMFSGDGRLFFENGSLQYDGGFSADMFSGSGRLYDENGNLVFIGDFLNNEFHGQGVLFDSLGRRIYDGSFIQGLHDGSGRLFLDGVLLYEGGFSRGMKNGEGTLFDVRTGFPAFRGKFFEGARMEYGIEFDEDGNPVIEAEQALPPPDPVTLLGKSYSDVINMLILAGITVRAELSEDNLFAIDENSGVLYRFSIGSNAEPGVLTCVYYFGSLSAGGMVVGSDISLAPALPDHSDVVGLPEIIVLGYSNAHRGQNISATDVQGAAFISGVHTITAFYEVVPLETSATDLSETISSDSAVQSESEIPQLSDDESFEPEHSSEAASDKEDFDENPNAPAENPMPVRRVLFIRIRLTAAG